MTWMGYQPQLVADLRRRTRSAVDDLASIASDDPAAASAMQAVRLAHDHLEADWLPLLDRIASSTAMTAPVGLRPGHGGDGWSWFDEAASWLFGANNVGSITGVSSNERARAAAEAARLSGTVGTFAGTTLAYEVIESPPSTTLPNAQCAPSGCESFAIIVHERWFFAHNLASAPAPAAALPIVRFAGLAAKLFGRAEPDELIAARGRELDRLTADARSTSGAGRDRNVSVGRLTQRDREPAELQAVSGTRHRRRGFEDWPARPRFQARPKHEGHAEHIVVEAAARQLRRSDEAVLEVFTEQPMCYSCDAVLKQFHDAYPNVQVRVYYRMEVRSG